jgi:hypothetical protein
LQTKKPIRARRDKLALGGWVFIALFTMISSSCSGLQGTDLPTPYPSEYLPTVIALTSQAGKGNGEASAPRTGTPQPEMPGTPGQGTQNPASSTGTSTPEPPDTFTPTPTGPTATPYTLPPPPTPTATPQIPNAGIEIRNLGSLSRVVSPLHIYAYLKPGAGGKVRIELFGENQRLLARQIKVLNFVPVGAWAVFTTDLDFEISAAAEAGRLKISVDDEYGRIVALNSVPLILMSIGGADITPPADVLTPILIQEPNPKTLIQGGTVRVSGMARPANDKPLLIRLLTTDGQEIGMRLANISAPNSQGYGLFAVDVPYKVSEPERVLLTVSEGDASMTDYIHISTLEVMVSP